MPADSFEMSCNYRNFSVIFALCAFMGSYSCSTKVPGTIKAGCISNPSAVTAAPLTGSNLPDKSVAITVAGGPSDYTEAIVEYFNNNSTPAVFFVQGNKVLNFKHTMQRIKDTGSLIGSLSYRDKPLTDEDQPMLLMRRTDALITPYVTGNMFFFRPPAGAFNSELAGAMNDWGLKKYVGPIGWDIGADYNDGTPLDSVCLHGGDSVANCANKYMDAVDSVGRGILTFNDTHPNSLDLIKAVLTTMKSENYQFIRLDVVPDVKLQIDAKGGRYGTFAGAAACDDYH